MGQVLEPRMRARGGKTLAFNDVGTFVALHRMEAEMSAAGFSVGRGCAGMPTGLLFGDFDMAKWKNLNREDRDGLHGVVTGSRREGPLLVTIFDDAPPAARNALSRMFGDRLRAAYQEQSL